MSKNRKKKEERGGKKVTSRLKGALYNSNNKSNSGCASVAIVAALSHHLCNNGRIGRHITMLMLH